MVWICVSLFYGRIPTSRGIKKIFLKFFISILLSSVVFWSCRQESDCETESSKESLLRISWEDSSLFCAASLNANNWLFIIFLKLISLIAIWFANFANSAPCKWLFAILIASYLPICDTAILLAHFLLRTTVDRWKLFKQLLKWKRFKA